MENYLKSNSQNILTLLQENKKKHMDVFKELYEKNMIKTKGADHNYRLPKKSKKGYMIIKIANLNTKQEIGKVVKKNTY